MSVSVFVPGHITGFFNISSHENPLKNGSCGCGFLLNKGVTTTIKKTTNDETSIKINGKVDLRNEGIIHKVLELMNISGNVKINQKITLPIGAGFGTSASSALGTAIGISKLMDLNHSIEESGKIAHLAEISLGSGLGDVIAELGKGIVLRRKPGAPSIGKTTSFDKYEIYIGCKTFSKIDTASIIQNNTHKKIINENGIKAMANFLKDTSINNFLKESYKFSKNTKLMNTEVSNLVELLNNENDIIGSSMAMLGNTVFAFAEDENTLKNLDMDVYKLNNEGITWLNLAIT